MDLSTLSDADLKAVAAGDMSKVSDEGLQVLAGKPKPKAGFPETAGAGLAGGAANTALGAGAAVLDYLGGSDLAKSLDAKRAAVQEWQKQHGGDTTLGRVASGVGSMAPGLLAGGEGLIPLLYNGVLFGIPGFRDTFNEQRKQGASVVEAAQHAVAEAGMAMVGGKLVGAGGKVLPKALQAGEGVAGQLAAGAAEGAAFHGADTALHKGIDVANGRQTDAPWIDPRGMADSALSFGVLRGAHMAMNAPAKARAAAADKAAADAKAQQDYEAQQKAAADAEAAKQSPDYLKQLDAQYRAMLQEQQAARAALGPKPKDKTDPSAVQAWDLQNKALLEQFNTPENKSLVEEHASRRAEIDALNAQEQAAAAAAAQQAAFAPNADQTDTRTPIDNGAPAANAQPDLFTEGKTAPSGAGAPAVEVAPSIDQQLQQANEALRQNQAQIDTLRGVIEEAHKQGDMQAVLTHSKAANQLAAQTKPLEEAVAKLQSQHAPTVKANIDKIKKQLGIAVANGDTAQTEKLATKITELQKQVQSDPQQTVDAAPAQNAKIDSELANQMADGREQAAAANAKVGEEAGALQRIGEKATQPSEAQGVLAAQAKEAQGSPKPTAEPKQQPLEGIAETPGELSDQQLEGRVDKLAGTLVDPKAADNELKIRNLKLERAQQRSIGREDLAAETQSKIAALESQGRINPNDADLAGRIDSLFAEREKLREQGDRAKAAQNAQGVEEAAKKMGAISDQLAQVQKEPGSVAGRLVKAKNDTAAHLNALFDTAHEMHTTGIGRYLREQRDEAHGQLAGLTAKHNDRLQQDARRRAANLPENNPVTKTDLAAFTKARDELVRKLDMLDRQLGSTNNEVPLKKLAMQARQTAKRYIRATFREENIRREARNQPPLTGKERADFADQVQKQTEALIQRAGADRNGDYMEEHVVRPAQMRSGKIVSPAVTEMRDTRPLEERPYGKFGAARAVEEQGFHEARQKLSKATAPQRVETGVLKRQWQATEEKRIADERGENAKTITGQQRRRAEYLTNQLDALERDNPRAAGERFVLQPLREALEQSPTNGVMDAIEPLIHEARTGRMPMEADINRVKEAEALARVVREDTEGQRGLFDPQTAIGEQGRIEDKMAEVESKVEEIDNAKYKSAEGAAKALKQREALEKERDALEQQLKAAKTDERALKDEAQRTSTAYERTTPARFENAPDVKAGRIAARKAEVEARRTQHETHIALGREAAKPVEEGALAKEQAAAQIAAMQKRKLTAVEQAKQTADIDAAVEERMRLEEAARRLAKLPTTVVTRDSALTDAVRTGLNREASGIRAKVDLIEKMRADKDFIAKSEQAIKDAVAEKKPAAVIAKMKNRLADAKSLDVSDEGLRKWEKLLENSERSLQQLEGVAPRVRETRVQADKIEGDDVLQATPLDEKVAKAAAFDPDKVPLKAATPEADSAASKRTRKKDASEAVAAAEALNDKQVVGGRGVVTRKIGAGQGKLSVDRKRAKTNAGDAVADGNKASKEKRIAELNDSLDRADKLAALNDKRLAEATAAGNKKDIKKYTEFQERITKNSERMQRELDDLDPQTGMDDVAMERKDGKVNDTPLSDNNSVALGEGRLQDVVADIAATSTNPIARRVAGRIHDLLGDVKSKLTDTGTKDNPDAPGAITADGKTVLINKNTGRSEEAVLHESVHAATMHELDKPDSLLTPVQRAAKSELTKMMEQLKADPRLENTTIKDGDIHEFVAEGHASKPVQDLMAQIPWHDTNMKRGFFQKILDFIGFPTPPKGNMRDRMLDLAEHFMKAPEGRVEGRGEVAMLRKESYLSDLGKMGRGMSQNRSVVDDVKQAGPSKLALAMEQKLVDFRASLRRIAKIGDKHTGTQVLGDILSADRQIGNLQAAASDGAFKLTKDAKGLMMMGAGGGTNVKDVAEAIGRIPGNMSADEKMDMFQAFMSGKRANDVGWDKLNYDNPVGMQNEYSAAMAKLDPATKQALEKAQDVYHEMNKGLVRFLAETDTLPKELTDKMTADRNYIPFFRNNGDTLDMVLQDGSMRSVGDVRTLPFLHALNGGNEKVMPFEQAMLKNIGMLTNLGVQNMTNRHIAYHLQGLGANAKVMQIREGKGPAGDNIMRFRTAPDPKRPRDDGERHIVIDTKGTAAEHIPSDLLAQAVAGTYASVPSLLKVGTWASDLLRAGVTRMPTYGISQLLKDPMNAAMMGNLKADPVSATLKTMNNFQEYLRGRTPEGELMARHGVLHSNVFNGSKDDLPKIAMQLAGGNQSKYKQFMAKLDKIAMSADAATRVQGYRDIIKAGGSELEAMIHAQEMQNFSKRGSSASVQMMSRMIPFFNAQIQGLNVMAKSMQGKTPGAELLGSKEAFMRRALGMSTLALVAASQLEDDPEWNRLTLGTTMGHIPIPGTDYSAPAPFESGMMFWSLPIAFMHSLKQNFSDNDWHEVRTVLANQIPGNGSLIPQVAKGYLDYSRNYNSAFGSPIETPGMEKKEVTERFTASTPELIKAFSRQLNAVGVKLSPVQIDYLANAYLGQFPHMVAALVNHLLETKSNRKDMGEPASGSAHDNPMFSRFTYNPAESRHVNDAYDVAKQAALTTATVKSMIKDGRADEARAYQQEQFKNYGTPQQATAFTNQMGFYRRQIEAINENAKLSGDDKQQQLEALYKRRDKTAKDWLDMVARRRGE